MTTENRDFKGVWIPKEVWLDDRLSAVEKIILVEIDSLDSTERGCWASNQHIAKFCQVSERTVSSAISKLKDLGYIYVQSFDGRQRELKSRFTSKQGRQANFASEGSKICEADMQDLRQSNTSNKTVTNTSKEIYVEIVDYLNAKAGTRYKASTASTHRLIKARLNEGFTIEDFKAVIDKKCNEWLTDSKMEQYLRPETLFGTKFEGYLNAKPQQSQRANMLPPERRETQAEQDKVIELMSQLKA